MKKNMAFTLAEVLITLTTIGVLAVIMIQLMDTKGIYQKTDATKVYKAFEEVQLAAARIRGAETNKCPEGTFLTKVRNPAKDIFDKDAYTYEYALFSDDNATSLASTANVYNLFANYLRFEKGNLNFCDYTSYCSNSAIKGGRMAGDIYVGFEVTANTSTGVVSTCPTTIYMPKFNKEDYKNKVYYEKITKTEAQAGKCWGKVYVFIKRKPAQNTLGKDIFVWGLDENGIAH